MQNNSAYIAWLIKKQWIRKELVPTDLFTIDVIDHDFVGGRRPMIMEMEALVDIVASGIEFIDLADTPSALGTPGQILQVNDDATALEFVDPIDDFIDLLDTPLDYTNSAGFHVVVNQAEDGLEFIEVPAEELKFEARVDFNNTNDPTISQGLESNLGTSVTLSRTVLGTYRATFGAVLTAAKLIAWFGNTTTGTFIPTIYSTTYIEFEHHAFVGGLVDTTQDDVSVEIKLYP